MLEASNGASRSVWMDFSVPDFPPLQTGIETDVCVIGAGIAGLTSAYLLSQAGKHVVLLDAVGIGAGETGRTTAHFFPPDEWYFGIEKAFGAAATQQIAKAFSGATELVESIVRKEKIECEFERLDGFLYALPGSEFKDLREEHDAARRAGVDVEYLDRVPGLSFDTGPCVRYTQQAQFHPLKYLAGLARAFIANVGKIHCHSRALSVEGDDTSQLVTTDEGTIRAQSVLIAISITVWFCMPSKPLTGPMWWD